MIFFVSDDVFTLVRWENEFHERFRFKSLLFMRRKNKSTLAEEKNLRRASFFLPPSPKRVLLFQQPQYYWSANTESQKEMI